MNLTQLKKNTIPALIKISKELGLEDIECIKKQNIIFSILRKHVKQGENIFGDGVLEVLREGFGFLRSPCSSYLAGPDDIYVSPSQINKFGLRTGDNISGKIRHPKNGERYFALLKIETVNHENP